MGPFCSMVRHLGRQHLLVFIAFVALTVVSCARKSEPGWVSGTIETDEVHVASRYGGRVQKIHAEEGDTLKANQLLIELDAAELTARRDQLKAVLAELEAGPRKEEIATAKADWEAQLAQLDFAKAEAKRLSELFEQKTVSASERDSAVSRAQALEKSGAAAKSRYDLLLAGTRPERIEQARAELATVEAQLKEMNIYAPSDSALEILNVKVGDVLPANREVATLTLPQHIWIRVYVPETWLGYIHVNGTAKLKVDSFPDKTFQGTVEQVARQAEFTPRNVQTVEERMKQVYGIKIRLDPTQPELRPGMSADAFFPEVPDRFE